LTEQTTQKPNARPTQCGINPTETQPNTEPGECKSYPITNGANQNPSQNGKKPTDQVMGPHNNNNIAYRETI